MWHGLPVNQLGLLCDDLNKNGSQLRQDEVFTPLKL